jgi:hypothetical protein
LSVYDQNSKFRLLGCTKRGQQRYLKAEVPFSETVVVVCGAGDHYHMVKSTKARRPCPESDFKHYQPLADFLTPFEVLSGQGQYNLTWWRLVTDHFFQVPPAQLELLPAVMMKTMANYQHPLLLQEVVRHEKLYKFFLDLDGLPAQIDLAGLVIPRILHLLGLEVPCQVAEAPPKQVGRRYLHLIFQCTVPAQAYKRVLSRIARQCPKEWNIDGGPTSLRTCGSDKIDRQTGGFQNRPIQPHLPDADAYAKCSLLVGLQGLPSIPVSAVSSQKPSKEPAVVPAETLSLILEEIQDKLGPHTLLAGNPKHQGRVVWVSTTATTCPWANRDHRSNTQWGVLSRVLAPTMQGLGLCRKISPTLVQEFTAAPKECLVQRRRRRRRPQSRRYCAAQ